MQSSFIGPNNTGDHRGSNPNSYPPAYIHQSASDANNQSMNPGDFQKNLNPMGNLGGGGLNQPGGYNMYGNLSSQN